MGSLEQRISDGERANARLRKIVWCQALLFPIIAVLAVGTFASAKRVTTPAASAQTLTVKEVDVVDDHGIVRARLGGDLPDAHYRDGHVAHRGSKMGGLLIYDEEGIERGGYGTMDTGSEALLTLDSKVRQVALFAADPGKEQSAALVLWRPGSSIDVRSDSAGSRLSVTDGRQMVSQLPAISTLPPEVCISQRALEKERKGTCRTRFTEAACHQCLDGG